MGKIKVDVNRVIAIQAERTSINRLGFHSIEWCDGDKPIEIDPYVHEQFELCGLNNVDFISSGYYLKKMSLPDSINAQISLSGGEG